MNRDQINQTVQSNAEETVSDALKSQVKKAICGNSAPKERAEIIIEADFEASVEVKKIVEVFKKHFSDEDTRLLGLPPIRYEKGKWYVPWDKGSFVSELNHCGQLEETKKTRPDLSDAAQSSLRELQTYLSAKMKRRDDSSFFAVRYKTLLAKLIHKIVERIELLNDRMAQKKYYSQLLEFLEFIWSDETLIKPELREDPNEIHIAHFLHAEMNLCECRLCDLSFTHSPHALLEWIKKLDKDLASMHLVGARLFHVCLQGETIPENLELQLNKLGNTYHLLWMAEQDSDGMLIERVRFSISEGEIVKWKNISGRAKIKIKQLISTNEHINFETLLPWVKKGDLTLKEAVFFNFDKNLTADQCLFLALYEPELLPLSISQRDDLFGSKNFLKLYRSDPEVVGFQWLKFHIQQASDRLFPVLNSLMAFEGSDSDEDFQRLLKFLKLQINQLKEDQLICPKVSELGIFIELKSRVRQGSELVSVYEKHLVRLQNRLHSLVLIRALLSQYMQLMPALGEIVGAWVLRGDLMIISQKVGEILVEIQNQISELHPLQGRGYLVSLNPQQEPKVIKQSGLFEIINDLPKPGQALTLWRKQAAVRRRVLDDLSSLSREGILHLSQLPTQLTSARLNHLQKIAKRQFNLARYLLNFGFAGEISREQQSGLLKSETVMQDWVSLTDSFSEIKRAESPIDDSKSLPKHKINGVSYSTVKISTLQNKKNSIPSRDKISSYLEEISSKGVEILKNRGFEVALEKLIKDNQEGFYTIWATLQDKMSRKAWGTYFSDQYNIDLNPLPILQKPEWFIWWNRHTIQDRDLFFKQLCFRALFNKLNRDKPSINRDQLHAFNQLVTLYQIEADRETRSRWSFLDRFRCNLKEKYLNWAKELTRFQIQYDRTTLEKELKISEKTEEKTTVIHTQQKTLMSIDAPRVESHVIVPSTPFPSKIEPSKLTWDYKSEKEWSTYQSLIETADSTFVIMLCLAFFKSVDLRFKKGEIISSEEQIEKLEKTIQLFMKIFNGSLSCHWLATPLRQLVEKVNTQKTSITVKIKFFSWWADMVVRDSEEKEKNRQLNQISATI